MSFRPGPGSDDAPETTSLVLSMLPAGCTDSTQLDCVDRASYLHDIFLASDTTMAILTDVPNSGPSNAPIPFPEALRTQQITAGLTDGGASRLLVENIIAPNVGPVERDPAGDVERHGVGTTGRLQGVHGLEPDRSGLFVAGPDHRAAHRPARTRPRREGVRRPQGSARW